jgi:hypothetical protein
MRITMFACIIMLHKTETKKACDHVWWSRGGHMVSLFLWALTSQGRPA